ncbi:MAG TPA: aquaporin [Blastocatellia bacterium]|nr:aquaporin [Blastocatellia bacterium]
MSANPIEGTTSAKIGKALNDHWPEYLMEAAELGIFMISACFVGALLSHPSSPVSRLFPDPGTKRIVGGIAMGLTAIGIIYSPFGKQSGAHLNPSVTLTFLRLGKIEPVDAVFYVIAQFIGGIAGVLVSSILLGMIIAHPAVNYVTTVPGPDGARFAFLGEFLISLIMMLTILTVSNNRKLSRWTGVFGGALVATYISIESPLSGMSMNPARTLGSAVLANSWTALWVYFAAPPLAMLLAAEIYSGIRAKREILCAKLHHQNNRRCIFKCGYMMSESRL